MPCSQAVLAHDIPHEILTAEQVNERFPGYRLPANFKVRSAISVCCATYFSVIPVHGTAGMDIPCADAGERREPRTHCHDKIW